MGRQRRVFQAALQAPPAQYSWECHGNSDQATSQSGPEYRTDTTNKAGNHIIHWMSHVYYIYIIQEFTINIYLYDECQIASRADTC